jgi:hypothetical protein
MDRLEVGTECGSHRRQPGVYVAMSQVPRVTMLHGMASATAPTAASAAGAAATVTTAAMPTACRAVARGTAATKAHAASGSADETPIEPEHQKAMAAPTTQHRGSGLALPLTCHKPAGDYTSVTSTHAPVKV